jgi:uridine phosphorylase
MIKAELILNPDGSIYHLNTRPEQVAAKIIFVGDPDRVTRVSSHFDRIDERCQKREFITHTGIFKNHRVSVISTGIGAGNIDIVLNELDALFNLNLTTGEISDFHTRLDIVRIGTSGAIQADINVDSHLVSTHGLHLGGLLRSYVGLKGDLVFESALKAHRRLPGGLADPILIQGNTDLLSSFGPEMDFQGISVTADGFYGPQGREIRLKSQLPHFYEDLQSFEFQGLRLTNLEMETAVIYGLSELLGHRAISLNAILANRENGEFSSNPDRTIDALIEKTLQVITTL